MGMLGKKIRYRLLKKTASPRFAGVRCSTSRVATMLVRIKAMEMIRVAP